MDIIIKPTAKDVIRECWFDITRFSREILEWELHPEQDKCLSLIRAHSSNAVLLDQTGITTGNRWGKGELVMVLGSFVAAFKPTIPRLKQKQIDILNTSISQDQANIVFDKFCNNLLDKPRFSWLIKEVKRSPFPHIQFKNNVTWWFRNASQDGKFLEGRSYLYANFDEADLQPDFQKFIDDILSPRLWDYGGWLTWTTTPRRGKKNAYKLHSHLERMQKAGERVAVFNGDSRANTFLHPSAIAKMNALPPRLLNKNVRGLYEDSEGEITNDALDFCETIAAGLLPEPTPGLRCVNFWDLARTSTYTVGGTIEVGDPLQLRSWERHQDPKRNDRTYWQGIAEKIRYRQKKWGGVTVIDATGLGDVIASFIEDINPICIQLGTAHGSLRSDIIDLGLSFIQSGKIGLPLSLISQHSSTSSWCARDELADFERSSLDHIIWDFVCALFLGIWVASGKHNAAKVSKDPPRIIPIAKGVSRHAVS